VTGPKHVTEDSLSVYRVALSSGLSRQRISADLARCTAAGLAEAF
jgi:transcription initiation factor TFIIIB Brf1 subunit/transcription initiation factor TFIIB